uniref:Reverse transcriptase zinc-binding domain-containing protein n=1 Tax=Cajanus cajan TaxID=3821 RepID=A0A151U473_CAJCA|nr:hypothetical protein KK1_006771 [Cajanus cajan]
MLDRLATEENLTMENIMVNEGDLSCPFYERQDESLNHVLFVCNIIAGIWDSLFSMLGIQFVSLAYAKANFLQHIMSGRISTTNIKWRFIWCSLVWIIWNKSNKCVFQNKCVNLEEITRDTLFAY